MVHKPKDAAQEHLDDLLDAALAGTFPASDPVAHLVGRIRRAPATGRRSEGRTVARRRRRAAPLGGRALAGRQIGSRS